MSFANSLRSGVALCAVYVIVYAFSTPLPPPHLKNAALFAQVEGAITQKCQPGYTYDVRIYQGSPQVTVAKVAPPNTPASEPAIVHVYEPGVAGYEVLQCKPGGTVNDAYRSAFASPPAGTISTDSAGGPLAPTPGGSLSPSGFGSSFEGMRPEERQNVPAGTETPVAPKVLDVGTIDAEIQQQADANIANDPKIKGNAFDTLLCQQQGTCDVAPIESGDVTTGQSLRAEAQNAVRADTFKAIGEMYGSDYSVQSMGDNAVAKISSADLGARYYDTDTGQPFLSRAPGDKFPTILTNEGAYPTSAPIDQWRSALGTLDKTEFPAFEGEYFGKGSPPAGFRDPEVTNLPPEFQSNVKILTIDDSSVYMKSVPRDAFDAVRVQGDISTGAADTIAHIQEESGGKILINTPNSFPSEMKSPWTGALTQPSSEIRAATLKTIEEEILKYPPEFWQNANPVTVHPYSYTPAALAAGVGSLSGQANQPPGTLFLNSMQDSTQAAITFDHELTHVNQVQLFGSEQNWGQTVYGPQYPYAYAGQKTGDVVAANFRTDARPEGFIEYYGFGAGIHEDWSTTAQSMFTNYSAVQQAAQTDPVLAQKVALAQQGFYNMSNGVMDQRYWDNLKPIDPNFTLKSPTPISTILQWRFGF